VGIAPALAQPQPVACGAVIDTPGHYALAGDLSCGGMVPPPLFCDTAAITITAAHVHLDGHGFTVSGNGFPAATGVGIRITSTNATVKNIGIEHFSVGIDIVGGARHHLEGVRSRLHGSAHCGGTGIGIRMTDTTDNHVRDSTISDNERWGVQLTGAHRNRLIGNAIQRNQFRPGDLSGNVDLASSNRNAVRGNDLSRGGLFGVRVQDSSGNTIADNLVVETATPAGIGIGVLLVESADNTIQDNVVDRAPAPGTAYIGISIAEGSTENTLRGNEVFHHSGSGIVVRAGTTDNVVRGNRAVDNLPFDAVDENANCDTTTWKNNDFGTVSQACID
jgi:parallel beta-helix repeat protein